MEDLLLEGNTVSGHAKGVGLVVSTHGRGRWTENVVFRNGVGVEVSSGFGPELVRNKIHSNLRGGVQVLEGAAAAIVDCHLRSNGKDRVVSHEKRGTRTHGDDSGAGIVLHLGATATLIGNAISSSAGAGLFVHDDARAVLCGNTFHGNGGDAVTCRPRGETVLSDKDQRCTDRKRAITPAVVRRQRVPFDWTVRPDSVSADDKSLAERVAEMRREYEAQRGDGSGLAMLPAGADASMVCSLQ